MASEQSAVDAVKANACPWCHAPAGVPCRSRRSGNPLTWPHALRKQLVTPKDTGTQVNALCCECGSLRTVNSLYRKRNDPNDAWGPLGRAMGWAFTQTLKCDACGQPTRHAAMRPVDAPYRDYDEEQQLIALGDPDTGPYGRYTDVKRIRREYREMPFPRNPRLVHRRWNRDAERAWDDGTKRVTALCGEELTIERDPRRVKQSADNMVDGFVVAEIESDVELTDLDTGLSWVAMDCVDCCRVSNEHRAAEQRRRLRGLLMIVASDTAEIPMSDLQDLTKYLEACIAARVRRGGIP